MLEEAAGKGRSTPEKKALRENWKAKMRKRATEKRSLDGGFRRMVFRNLGIWRGLGGDGSCVTGGVGEGKSPCSFYMIYLRDTWKVVIGGLGLFAGFWNID